VKQVYVTSKGNQGTALWHWNWNKSKISCIFFCTARFSITRKNTQQKHSRKYKRGIFLSLSNNISITNCWTISCILIKLQFIWFKLIYPTSFCETSLRLFVCCFAVSFPWRTVQLLKKAYPRKPSSHQSAVISHNYTNTRQFIYHKVIRNMSVRESSAKPINCC